MRSILEARKLFIDFIVWHTDSNPIPVNWFGYQGIFVWHKEEAGYFSWPRKGSHIIGVCVCVCVCVCVFLLLLEE